MFDLEGEALKHMHRNKKDSNIASKEKAADTNHKMQMHFQISCMLLF